jgi:hypothetical protein
MHVTKNGHFESDQLMLSYCVFRHDWTGRPTEAPSIDACWAANQEGQAYAGWDEATDIRAREVYLGSEADLRHA